MLATKKFSIEDYHRLIELGFFKEGDRIELIRGELVEMAAKGKRHVVCCRNLLQQLFRVIGSRALIQCQDPIELPNLSEPEPDFAIVRMREDNYLTTHPQPEDIFLVIEIADSSLQFDREVKLPVYAEAGIENVWIFNLIGDRLETYTQPYLMSSGTFEYRNIQIFLPEDTVALPRFEDLQLELSRIFPNRPTTNKP
ncbi:Uma2 family endonuclease [Baaleninema simplex]|uniref:Uma2 family endonuclease n=1 Tax=Baaleninema simplex TaxID=2862350 RepID=UPI00034A429C|nr:Uma2 family endonuclease [Baaleninema simplex]